MKKKGILYDLNWKYSIYPINSSDIMKENYDKQFTCNQELWPQMVFTANSTDGGLRSLNTWYVYQSQM